MSSMMVIRSASELDVAQLFVWRDSANRERCFEVVRVLGAFFCDQGNFESFVVRDVFTREELVTHLRCSTRVRVVGLALAAA